MRKVDLFYIFVVAFVLVKSIFLPGFYKTHDDTQVTRVAEMTIALRDGMFPVRWVPNLGYGYGYPLFSFYAPFAYYVGSLFHFLTGDALIATKAMIALPILLSGIFMYIFTRSFYGRLGAITSSVFYMIAPYVALNTYVRGDVAELWAYSFIPLAFYGLWQTIHKKSNRYIVVGSIGFAGIILSHNLTALMITPFLLAFALVFSLLEKKALRAMLVLIFGLFLSAFYWLPVFFEMPYTNVLSQVGGGADFRNHFVCLRQLWDSPWMFGGSVAGCIDGISFRTGKVHLVMFFLSVSTVLLLGSKIEKKRKKAVLLFFIFTAAASLFLVLEQSRFIWETVPLMAFFQYPWRFLLLFSFASAFLTGSIFSFIDKKVFSVGVFILLQALAFIFYLKLFHPQTTLPLKEEDYTDKQIIKWKISKISDEYMPRYFTKPETLDEVVQNKVKVDNGTVEKIEEKTQKISYRANLSKDSTITLRIAYFPAWKVLVDDKEVKYRVAKNGLAIAVSKGEHNITAIFSSTTIETIGNLVSLAGSITLGVGIIYLIKRKTV